MLRPVTLLPTGSERAWGAHFSVGEADYASISPESDRLTHRGTPHGRGIQSPNRKARANGRLRTTRFHLKSWIDAALWETSA